MDGRNSSKVVDGCINTKTQVIFTLSVEILFKMFITTDDAHSSQIRSTWHCYIIKHRWAVCGVKVDVPEQLSAAGIYLKM